MLGAERLEFIRDYILKNRYGSIIELAAMLETSPATVRRCLKQLEDEQLVESVRGGAVLASGTKIVEQPYTLKRIENTEEKKRIAAEAVRHISPGDSIFLDSSSTVFEMCTGIKDIGGLNISTNDTLIAGSLSGNCDSAVTVTGGKLRHNYYTLTGFVTMACIKQLSIDTFFTAVDAVSRTGDFMITNGEEVENKRFLMENSGKTIVLCDHSKFSHNSFISLWDKNQIDLVITGIEMDDELFAMYSESGMPIIRV